MGVNFDRVLGQAGAKALLKNAEIRGVVSPVYLFEGPLGVGKATLALEFVKAVNCEEEEKPCGRCSSCLRIGHFTHPDLWVLLPDKPEELQGLRADLGKGEGIRPPGFDPTGTISIQAVRELEPEFSRAPFEAKRRFVLVLDAENLSLEAQNIFLKTLEEPPPVTTFILISSNPLKLLPTVRSRVRRVRFTPLTLEDFSLYPLNERYPKFLLYRLSEGSIGQAKDWEQGSFLGLRQEILERIGSGNLRDLLFLLLEIKAGKQSLERKEAEAFLGFYLTLVRDLLFVKVGARTLLLHLDLVPVLEKVGARFSLKTLEEMFRSASLAEEALRRNVNVSLLLYELERPLFNAISPWLQANLGQSPSSPEGGL